MLLRNRNRPAGHWLGLKLVGTRSNRDGFGARVEVKTGAVVQTQEARSNSSFESASDPRLHFGLGDAHTIDAISIHWPSGIVQTLPSQGADQQLTVEEGKGVVRREDFQRQKSTPTPKAPPRRPLP